MTSLKMWYFLFLFFVPTLAEVVKLVSDCDRFLLDESPPQVPGILEGGNILNQSRYKPICQTFENQRRFFTLYDVQNRIPVFSAYRYRGEGGGKRPQNSWNIEPQLEKEDDKNMMVGDKNKTYDNQAGNTDYRNNGGFDRGHLFPSAHALTKSDKKSTFTLTNIVPQAGTFNKGSWNNMEKCIECVMAKYCINNNGIIEGFVVTGAQPSTNNILKNRVNIPSMLWSAFCCYSSNMSMWIASAHWSDNVPDESKSKHLQTKTLEKLHQELRKADSEFKVFPGTQCPLHTTVTELYPDMKNCQCPPSPQPPTSGPLTPTSDHPTTTSGPPQSTSAPLPTTSSSATTTSGPATSPSSPLTITSGHPNTTPGPLPKTYDPFTTTFGPATSASGRPTATPGPLTTSDPFTTRYAFTPFTSGSHTITSGSVTTTSSPATTTSGVVTPTAAPSSTTSGAFTRRSNPVTATSGPPIS